jgi:hypothetical protein
MNKKLIALTSIIIFLILILLIATQLPSTIPVKQPRNGEYLHYPTNYQEGRETKVLLVDSQLHYGAYNESFTRSGSDSINKGDPCVIINGTIRNDYDEDYYFCLTADVYNSKGEKIGPILTISSPVAGFTVAKVNNGTVGFFEIQIKYDRKDIVSYDLFVAFEPTENPPA